MRLLVTKHFFRNFHNYYLGKSILNAIKNKNNIIKMVCYLVEISSTNGVGLVIFIVS